MLIEPRSRCKAPSETASRTAVLRKIHNLFIMTIIFICLILECLAAATLPGNSLTDIARYLDFPTLQTFKKTVLNSPSSKAFPKTDLRELSLYQMHSSSVQQEAFSQILDIRDPKVQLKSLDELMANQNLDVKGNYLVKPGFSNNYFLREAVRRNRMDLVEYFLNPSASWAKRLNLGLNGNYLLKDAVASGNTRFFKLVIQRLVVTPSDQDLKWIYILAKQKNNKDIVDYLTKYYRRTFYEQDGGLIGLMDDVLHSDKPSRRYDLDILLYYFPKDTNLLAESSQSPLTEASATGARDLLKMFLQHGWNPKGNSYSSPLSAAIANNQIESVKLLLNAEKLNLVHSRLKLAPHLDYKEIVQGIYEAVPQHMEIAHLLIKSERFNPALDHNHLLNVARQNRNRKMVEFLLKNRKVLAEERRQAHKKQPLLFGIGNRPDPITKVPAGSPREMADREAQRDKSFFD